MNDLRELLRQAERAYGRYLRSLVTDETFFPLSLQTGKSIRPSEYAAYQKELDAFRSAVAVLGITVEWSRVKATRFGEHDRPEKAYFADQAAYLLAVGKTEEARRFRSDLALIRESLPEPDAWAAANVREIVAHHGSWPELLRVTCWLREHPRCGLYLRQLPVEDVDTKFFETRKGIIESLVLHATPTAVDMGAPHFEGRFGLRWEQPLIRLRFLDPYLQTTRGFPIDDITIPVGSFRQLRLECVTAIITENLRNFLALPALPGCVAVLGSGDAAALLAGASWMFRSRLLYWGDMDRRGFVILDRLRGAYPHLESVLMDTKTFSASCRFAGADSVGETCLCSNLTPAESEALALVSNSNRRLEQERIPYPVVITTLQECLRSAPSSPEPSRY